MTIAAYGHCVVGDDAMVDVRVTMVGAGSRTARAQYDLARTAGC